MLIYRSTQLTLLENYLHPRGAEQDSSTFLEVSQLVLFSEDMRSNWSDSPGYRFMQEYVLPMETPAMTSIFSGKLSGTSFVDGQKHSFTLKRTDGNYWKILDFTFIEGEPLTDDDNTQGHLAALADTLCAV